MTNKKPDVSPVKQALLQIKKLQARIAQLKDKNKEDIAIVGIGCRFPGGPNNTDINGADDCWQLLKQGINTAGPVPSSRWLNSRYYMPFPAAEGKLYTQKASFLSAVDQFDASFFAISGRDAEAMDPQQRILLEVAYQALEDAGIDAQHLEGSNSGVFMGLMNHDYADWVTGLGTSASVLSGRLSYLLGLQGPSLTLDTACSSSLVALHLACKSLQLNECNLALVGGVNLQITAKMTIAECAGKMLSPDGICKTFDTGADGYGRSDGCGVLILKRLSEALADNDRIYAIVAGSAVLHDGASGGLTVPNGPAQEKVIRAALADANVTPEKIAYVEAHGTGTALGDPIELNALQNVYGEAQNKFSNSPVFIATAKTNFGHMESAAGVVGVIKAALSLYHKGLPAHLNLVNPTPHFDWQNSALKIVDQYQDWPPRGHERFAAVSGFGVSGTNAHIVLREINPVERVSASTEDGARASIIKLSAKTKAALQDKVQTLSAWVATAPQEKIQNVARTLNCGRSNFEYRLSFVVDNIEELNNELSKIDAEAIKKLSLQRNRESNVAMLFSGQGSQYPAMGKHLYDSNVFFRQCLDNCAEILVGMLDKPLLSLLWGADQHHLSNTKYTQPALFCIQYALAQTWRYWGIEADYVLGHSVGEYAAACHAGVFSLNDGLSLITARAQLMTELCQTGGMVVVFAEVKPIELSAFGKSISVAAFNGSRNTVISGEQSQLDALCESLAQREISFQALDVSHGFHSPLMQPMLTAFAERAVAIVYSKPLIPFVSTLTGGLVDVEIANANYWVEHLIQPVLYSRALASLKNSDIDTWLEIGPQATLINMARSELGQLATDTAITFVASLHPKNPRATQQVLASLFNSGRNPNWRNLSAGDVISMPSYPFQRQRYWLERAQVFGVEYGGENNSHGDQNAYDLVWTVKKILPVTVPGEKLTGENWLVISPCWENLPQVLCDALNKVCENKGITLRYCSLAANSMPNIDFTNSDKIIYFSGYQQPDYEQLEEVALPRDALRSAQMFVALLNDLSQLQIQDKSTQKIHLVIPLNKSLQSSFCSGAMRSAVMEIPGVTGKIIELDYEAAESVHGYEPIATIEMLCNELIESGDDHWIRIAQKEVLVPRLVPKLNVLAVRNIASDCVYWISGGYGTIGLASAHALIAAGAKHLVLFSRKGAPQSENESYLRLLKSCADKNIICQSERIDVTNPAELTALLERHKNNGLRLGGVIHSAGEGDFSPIQNLSEEAWQKVCAGKVAGAWNLHRVTQAENLSIFVLVSSISSVWGAQGNVHYSAANAFLDVLADYRLGLGKTALSLNLGPMTNSQLLTESQNNYLNQSGLHHLDPLPVMQYALSLPDQSRVIVAAVDWTKLSELVATKKKNNIFNNLLELEPFKKPDLAAVASGAGHSNLNSTQLSLWLSLPDLQRLPVITNAIEVVFREVLKLNHNIELDRSAPLSRLGVDSLTALEIRDQLQKLVDIKLPASLIYDYSSIQNLAEHLSNLIFSFDTPVIASPIVKHTEPIAIVGIGCRFPGKSNSADDFWRLLCDGVDAIEDRPERWDINQYLSDGKTAEPGKAYTLSGGFIDEVEYFANTFFDISTREALAMDPQQRLVLEVTWQALENAGLSPMDSQLKNTGVFIGVGANEYGKILSQSDNPEQYFGHMPTGNALNAIAGRVSFQFGFTGPSFAVDSACSSSLLALHQAVNALRQGECDYALAGGVDLLLSADNYVLLSQAQMLSPTGRSKAFDARADGYTRGEGCGLLVLMPLSKAIANKHHVIAEIKGTAVNQDGSSTSFTAPNGKSQQEVILQALRNANVAAAEVGYIEAHGTGTALGDPVEMHALDAVYGNTNATGSKLNVGSVKTNIGHLEAAAGIAGLIKTALILQHAYIPKSLHFQVLNPHIQLRSQYIRIASEAQNWTQEKRVAGVSSFGFSGTNGHVILASSEPTLLSPIRPAPDRLIYILSAKSIQDLKIFAAVNVTYLENCEDILSACFTSQLSRGTMEYKLAVVAGSKLKLIEQLRAFAAGDDKAVVVSKGVNAQPWILKMPTKTIDYKSIVLSLVQNNIFLAKLLRDYGLTEAYAEQSMSAVAYALVYWRWLFAITSLPSNIICQPKDVVFFALVANLITEDSANTLTEMVQELAETVASEKLTHTIVDRVKASHCITNVEPSLNLCLNGNNLDNNHLLQPSIWLESSQQNSHSDTFEITDNGRWETILVDLFCHGQKINWEIIQADFAWQRQVLPSYPWKRERLWPEAARAHAIATNGQPPTWPGDKIPLHGSNEIRYQGSICSGRYPHLKDHKIFQRELVAGASQIAAILNIAQLEFPGQPLLLRNVIFEQAMQPGADVTLQILLSPASEGQYRVASASYDNEHKETKNAAIGWKNHMSAQLEIADVDKVPDWMEIPNIKDVIDNWQPAQSAEALYLLMAELGYHLGESFRCLSEGWQQGDKVLHKLRLPDSAYLTDPIEQYSIYPGLLDSCFHAIGSCMESANSDADSDHIYVPFSIDRLQFMRKPIYSSELWCCAEMNSIKSNDEKSGNLVFWDEQGPVLYLEGFRSRKANKNVLYENIQTAKMYSWLWTEQKDSFPNSCAPEYLSPQSCVIYNSIEDVDGELNHIVDLMGLKAHDLHYTNVLDLDPSSSEYIIHWSAVNSVSNTSSMDGAVDVCINFFSLLQHLLSRRQAPKIIRLITTGGKEGIFSDRKNYQMALWSMIKCISVEYPEVNFQLVELTCEPSKNDFLIAKKAICAPIEARYLRVVNGELHTASIQNVVQKPIKSVQLTSSATYLITGGYGDLGQQLAIYLIVRGAESIVICGRKKRELCAELIDLAAKNNVKLYCESLDVSSSKAPQLLHNLMQVYSNIRGVFHLAAAYSDSTLQNQTLTGFAEPFAAKANGLWALHNTLGMLDLDYFVAFSSISSFLGIPGQANYGAANALVDGLIEMRRGQGMCGQSIQWGPWQKIGKAAEQSQIHRMQSESHGMFLIEPSDGFAQLDRILASNLSASVLSMDWQIFHEKSHVSVKSLFAGLVVDAQKNLVGVSGGGVHAVTEGLVDGIKQAVDEFTKLNAIKMWLRFHIASVLRIDLNCVGMDKGLNEMGFDSLMTIELRRIILKHLNIEINMVQIMNFIDVNAFASCLLELIVEKDTREVPQKNSALSKLDKLVEIEL